MPTRSVDVSGMRSAREQLARRDALAAALAGVLEGEVRFDAGSRALYATDASNYRQVPVGVVIPRTTEDVVRTVAACREHGVPVLARGGGTSLAGQCCNVAVVIDFSKYLNRVLSIDPVRKVARVQPGVVLDDLREQARRHGLTFGPDPATHNHNTLGGMIGNNSCGPHSVMAGETVRNVISLEVLTCDGERFAVGETPAAELGAIEAEGSRRGALYAGLRAIAERYGDEIRSRFPPIPRRVSGYNLTQLLPENGFHVARALVGSEGTCAVVLEAELRLVDDPPGKALAVLAYENVFEAADDVPRVMGESPIALEGIDDNLVRDMLAIGLHPGNARLLPDGGGWLLVEFGGRDGEDAMARARAAAARLCAGGARPRCALFAGEEARRIWQIRESGLGATAHVPNKEITWEGWEDSAVPPGKLGEYLRKLRALFDKYGYDGDLYGHFGQGCVHTRIDFDLVTAPGIEKYRAFVREAAELVVGLGGSISGEHGDGQSKAELLGTMFGPRILQAFREFKHLWDPGNRMNPGKIVDAYGIDENLRLGTAYDPPAVETHFGYPRDAGDFGRAMLRCVGVGECRKHEGTMCPSYMATGEEMHSTRGRARLLWEMLNGDVLSGWRDPAVKEALDLCLSCKACKHECPVSVDMATYKAEFLAHYYRHHRRPLAAWVFGRIDRWSRLAAHAPRLASRVADSALAKRILGVAQERRMPAFARPFTHGFRPMGEGREVILFPDTFNNHFQPHVARAAAATLQAAGCRVRLPPVPLCCGRPLYEHGLVDRARGLLQRILEALADDIRRGTPLVGLEPACMSVFRDELPNLFPHSVQARRLAAQSYLLPEFLAGEAPRFPFRREGRALVHLHCHERSVLGPGAQSEVLHRVGMDFEVLDSGCCGMAGSFGMERSKYEVSMRCAERVLAPAVRGAADDTLVVADGFSCREQIAHATGRRALHIAEVLSP